MVLVVANVLNIKVVAVSCNVPSLSALLVLMAIYEISRHAPGKYPQMVKRRLSQKSPPIPNLAATATNRSVSDSCAWAKRLTEGREERPKDKQQNRVAMMALGGQIDLGKLLWSIHASSTDWRADWVEDNVKLGV